MSPQPSKIAVVTGAARRIGRVIALFLAEHGWDVAVHYRFSEQDAMRTVQDIRNLGRRSVALRCDLTDEDAVNTLMTRVQQALGTPSCLVNNASVFEHDSVTDFSAHSLDFHMRTNLTAPVLLSRALYAMTPEGEQSVVINLLDQKLDNLNPSFLSYTLSKAALNTATTLLAVDAAHERGVSLRTKIAALPTPARWAVYEVCIFVFLFMGRFLGGGSFLYAKY